MSMNLVTAVTRPFEVETKVHKAPSTIGAAGLDLKQTVPVRTEETGRYGIWPGETQERETHP